MYAVISCANDRASAGIKVTVGWTGPAPVQTSRVELRRSFTGSNDYKVLCTKPVGEINELTEYIDIDPIAGVSYTYEYCALAENNAWLDGDEAEIVSDFEGVLIADSTGSWHSAYGTSENRFALNAQKNRPVNYIITLSGKFPHRVSNTRTNYWTGNCTGLWLPKGAACGEPSFEQANAYRQAFMEWLVTDTEKYLKASDGKAMIVSINGEPQEIYNGIEGMTAVSFDWTQIGEVERPALSVSMGKAWVNE